MILKHSVLHVEYIPGIRFSREDYNQSIPNKGWGVNKKIRWHLVETPIYRDALGRCSPRNVLILGFTRWWASLSNLIKNGNHWTNCWQAFQFPSNRYLFPAHVRWHWRQIRCDVDCWSMKHCIPFSLLTCSEFLRDFMFLLSRQYGKWSAIHTTNKEWMCSMNFTPH